MKTINQAGKLAVCAAISLCAIQHAQAQSYYALPGGVYVSGLSGNGSIGAAYSSTSKTFSSWSPTTGVTAIGGNWIAGDAGISYDGRLISGTSDHEAAVYNVGAGTWTKLGGLGGNSQGELSSGWGIAGNGQTVVGLGWIDAGIGHATQVAVAGGPMQDLGSAFADKVSRADAADYSGSVLAGFQDAPNGFRQGAYWKNGVETLLFSSTGAQLAAANDVSSNGKWIVGPGRTNQQSWRYNTDTNTAELLGDLNPSGTTNAATAVSADGSVIVGYDRSAGPATFGKGSIWIQGLGMMNLTDYAISHGVALPAGVVLALPLSISADGTTIGGLDNNNFGFVISIPSAVPEPSTYALALAGLGAVGLMVRRRKAVI